jgi:hypothetical protein
MLGHQTAIAICGRKALPGLQAVQNYLGREDFYEHEDKLWL